MRGSAVFAGVTLSVLVATQLPLWPELFAAQPAVSLPASLTRTIPSGDPVAITYPYDTKATNEPMLWQAEDAFNSACSGATHGPAIRDIRGCRRSCRAS